MTTLRSGSATDVGRVRANNQDQLLVTDGLFAVADGMGGHAAGEVASLAAVEALKATYQRKGGTEGLVEAAEQANRTIWERGQNDPELHGMGTTLVAVALVNEDNEDRLAIVNVGDSRVYLLRQGELEQLTTDHSLVQELVDDGQLSEVEATVHPQRHVLTRALGVDSVVNVDVLQLLPLKGDRLMLCSDGLPRELSDLQMASIMRRLADPNDAARELVSAAKNRGGNDNITVVVVDVVDDDDLSLTASMALESDPGLQIPSPIPVYEADTGESVAGRDSFGGGRFRRAPRQAAPAAPTRRAITFRVVGFLVLLIALVAGAGFAVAWYARGSYFVGLTSDELTIFKGRPGGLLWFEPTVAQKTAVRTSDVLPSRLSDLRAGKEEPSLGQARDYVTRLQAEKTQLAQGTTTTTTTPPDTGATTTTAPAVTTLPAP
ncbi:MAG: family protein phosphatase [Acidimicrobiaceae bacterium]|jgi:protein phosphatase|nr:family protein phosphatase [Acidimicrobiaceae bacterium]MDQ1441620.1 family protein phosphatase [Acidimicrobiaceae bacterium]